MTKRSVDAFNPTGIEYDRRFYTDNEVEAIVAAARGLPDGEVSHKRRADDASDIETVLMPRQVALAERLQSAAVTWHKYRQWDTEPTSTMRKNEYVALANACSAALTVLRLSPRKASPDILAEIPQALRSGGLQDFAAEEAERLGGMPAYSGAGLLRDSATGLLRLQRWATLAANRERNNLSTPREKRHGPDESLNELFRSLRGIWISVFDKTSWYTIPATGDRMPKGEFVDYMTACLRPLLEDQTPDPKKIRGRFRNLPGAEPMAKPS